jgi:hypothetical protein
MMMASGGYGRGWVRAADLAGIRFGGGVALFDNEPVRFNEEESPEDRVWDVNRIPRYPFNMR